jgi:hypothetical protein
MLANRMSSLVAFLESSIRRRPCSKVKRFSTVKARALRSSKRPKRDRRLRYGYGARFSLMDAAAQPAFSMATICFTDFVVGPDATMNGFLNAMPPTVTGRYRSLGIWVVLLKLKSSGFARAAAAGALYNLSFTILAPSLADL